MIKYLLLLCIPLVSSNQLGDYFTDGLYKPCEPGFFCDGYNKTACPPGTYNDLVGQVSCTPCQPGTSGIDCQLDPVRGSCTISKEGNNVRSYKCTCNTPYWGALCRYDASCSGPDTSNICKNDQRYTDSSGYFVYVWRNYCTNVNPTLDNPNGINFCKDHKCHNNLHLHS